MWVGGVCELVDEYLSDSELVVAAGLVVCVMVLWVCFFDLGC